MNVTKKVIGRLEKCYSIAPLHYNGNDYFLVAAEKSNRCILFDTDGNEKETVWTEPGGVMSMVQVPGSNGIFLATHKFYSPNDGADAYIVIVTPHGDGTWERRTLVDLPFVHRFDILTKNGKQYLIACTLKSAHAYKDDWRTPGKIYVAELPEDLSSFNDHHQLQLTVLQDGLLRNHGYGRIEEADGSDAALVSCANGIFKALPPENSSAQWKLEQLSPLSASDALLLDLDGDGTKELVVLSPFHGDTFSILHADEGPSPEGGAYTKTVFEYPEKMPFLHAIYGGTLGGIPYVVIGYRKGKRNLVAVTYDGKTASYRTQIIDENCGSANVFHFVKGGKDFIVSANREIDEIALYEIDI